MRPVYDLIVSLHHYVNVLTTGAGYLLHNLDHALNSNNEYGLHPDDIATTDVRLEGIANALREMAHEIEMRRIAIKQDVLRHQLAAE